MEGSSGDATRRYISTGTDAAGVVLFQNSSSAKPPKTAKIGSPRIVTRSSINSESGRMNGVPGAMTKPKSAGMGNPSAAKARPFQLGLACQTARSAMTPNPTSMIESATHLGTPGSNWLPDSRSERTNTQLAQARQVETAANPAAAAIFAGPRQDSGSSDMEDNASSRSDRDASM